MKYMGSKNKYAIEILNIINKYRKKNQPYVEPFCGGCNVIDKVKGIRIANDTHEYLICMWKALEKGWYPPKFVSEENYKDILKNKDKYPKFLVGYVGFNASYAGKYFGGYARNKERTRQYSEEAYRNITNQIPNIIGIKFYNKDYSNFPIPDNSIIYCDPPYQNTTNYSKTDKFNYIEFWNWCRLKVKEGHQIFISEYNAPKDFICIWSKNVNSSINQNPSAKQNIEKLFVHETQIKKYKIKSFSDF